MPSKEYKPQKLNIAVAKGGIASKPHQLLKYMPSDAIERAIIILITLSVVPMFLFMFISDLLVVIQTTS